MDGKPAKTARPREVVRRYGDPLDELWLAAAERIGFRVARSSRAFAASDGSGTITIGAAPELDADDCLAQMLYHEICHSLVQGRESFERTDWGLGDDEVREHACLRAQAHLAARHGLREVLAPTTDFRGFYDHLPNDPLADRSDAATQMAVIAIGRAEKEPWAPHLNMALDATAAIARAGNEFWAADSILAAVTRAPPPHSLGFHGSPQRAQTCGQCGWRNELGVCVAANAPTPTATPACERFELSLECETCGACCRAGYDSVTVEPEDPVVKRHPELIVERATYLELKRSGNRCAALDGGPTNYSCSIYASRPVCCRDLERGGEHCLTARRRVGLSIR